MIIHRSSSSTLYRIVALFCVASLLANLCIVLPAAAQTTRSDDQVQPASSGLVPSAKSQPWIEGPPGITVNLYNGSLAYSRVDLESFSGAYPFAILHSSLTYNSFLADRDSGFGTGWYFQSDIAYRTETDGDIAILFGGGSEVRFDNRAGTYYPPAGVYDDLVKTGTDSYRLETKAGNRYFFDTPRHRHVTRIETENNMAVVFTYDANGKLVRVKDDYGRHLDLAYDAFGRASAVSTNFLEGDLDLAYDGRGRLTTITDPAGNVTQYAYNTLSLAESSLYPAQDLELLNQVLLPDGASYSISYDSEGWVTAINGDLGSWHFAYGDGEGRVYRTVNGQVRRTRYLFDALGRVYQVEYPDGELARYEWDDANNLVSAADAQNNKITYSYDESGNLIGQKDPLGNITEFTYSGTGLHLLTIEGELGQELVYTYDERGNMLTETDQAGSQMVYTYDANQFVITETTPLGYEFAYDYDSFGRMTSETEPMGRETIRAFNPAGNLTSVIDPAGRAMTLTYNAVGWPTSFTDGLGNRISLAYDARGNLTGLTDAMMGQSEYRYDAAGNRESAINPLGIENVYQYDEAGNLLSATDGNGYETEYEYDSLDRLVRIIDANDADTRFSYDSVGNLTEQSTADGQTIAYEYDELGQLTGIDLSRGDDTVYSYDALGRLVEASNPAARIQYKYDLAGYLTDQVLLVSGQTYTTSYTYDVAGNRLSMTDPDGNLTQYDYDHAGQLTGVDMKGGRHFELSYDGGGLLEHVDLPNGNMVDYAYDAAGNLLEIVEQDDGAQIIGGESYEYDANGRIIKSVDLFSGIVTTYQYDAAGQLIKVERDGETIQWIYDAAGNRKMQLGGGEILEYDYDPANQLLAVDGTSEEHLTYDSRGNLIARATITGTTFYTYSLQNQLTAVRLPDGEYVSYRYGPDGQLLTRTDDEGTVVYLYDGFNLLMEKTAAGATLNRYTMMEELDQVIAVERGGQFYYPQRDIRGSIRALSDNSGNVIERHSYDPFGVPLNPIDSRQLAFSGRPYDPVSGLLDMRLRNYDPALGRFLQRDPIGEMGNSNLYIYLENSPTNGVDPFGLNPGFWRRFFTTGLWTGVKTVGAVVATGAVIVVGGKLIIAGKVVLGTGVAIKGLIDGYYGLKVASHEIRGKKYTGPTSLFDLVALKGAHWAGLSRQNKEIIRGLAAILDIGTNYAAGQDIGKFEKALQAANLLKDVKIIQTANKLGDAFFLIQVGDQYYTLIEQWFTDKDGKLRKRQVLVPASKAGRDHQDDTYSAASSQLSEFASYGGHAQLETLEAGSPQYRRSPRVALLWHGFAEEAASFLNALDEPYDTLPLDFSPAVAALYPVLIIPSGGLYGMEGSDSLRSRLEAYVENGGVLLVSTQQRGYEFSVVPGGLDGYGWAEDQSCFNASVTFPQYQQAISGFDKASLTLLVDGYFTDYPEEAVSLLDREKNGYPAAVLYPYGDGYVAATTIY
ncbi:MAG: hypothetical protein JXA42_15475, partial [Anaerolineales bacterium]|nr:hypothetical protein [Anaerolineales bacterium]